MEINRLTDKDFWMHEDVHGRHAEGHGIDIFIKKYIPPTTAGECLEIGSFPGPHLATFGDLGYTLNGIDFHPANKDAVPAWLSKEGFRIGEFVEDDFFAHRFNKKFDAVCSFGFIEHFEEYEKVILMHADLVEENGYLVITAPNFRGRIQKMLHKNFDRKNLAAHNLESMRPDHWAAILEKNGFEIIYKGYFGGFWFWRAPENHGPLKRKILWVTERMIPRLRKLLWFNSSAFSAYCGVVAKRIKQA